MPQASGTAFFCCLPYTKKPSPIELKSSRQSRPVLLLTVLAGGVRYLDLVDHLWLLSGFGYRLFGESDWCILTDSGGSLERTMLLNMLLVFAIHVLFFSRNWLQYGFQCRITNPMCRINRLR